MKKLIVIGILLAAGFSSRGAMAATMSAVSNSNYAAVGETFDVNIRVDSGDQTVNAAQGTVRFPRDILEVRQVTRTDSIFDIWLQEPSVNASTGEITFLGGSTNSYSGKSLQVLKITFRARSAGKADISFSDSAVTAGDGTGANILASSNTFSMTVGTAATATQPAVTVTPPSQIKRPAKTAVALPSKPSVNVPFYPDPSKWYGLISAFFANWNLPDDVTGVSTAVNQIPDFVPSQSEGLFDSKQFPQLSEGTWYLHVRFKNGTGWGDTAHVRIGIDTTPPSAFKISTNVGTSTSQTQPVLSFVSNDSLSGIDRYEVRVDQGGPVSVASTTYTLPFQPPGDHTVRVRALDNAGNSTESSLKINIAPNELPVFSIAGVGITGTWFSLFLLVVLALVFVVGIIVGRRRAAVLGERITIGERDILSLVKAIKSDIDKVDKILGEKGVSGQGAADLKHSVENIRNSAEKMERYAVEGIEDIVK